LPRDELGEAHHNLLKAFDYYVETKNTPQIVAIGEFPIIALNEHSIPTGSLAARALELVSPDSPEAARLHGLYGRTQGMEYANNKTAQESFDKALAIAKREGDLKLELTTLLNATQVDSWHHDFQLALERSQQAVEIAVSISDPRSEAAARYFLSIATRTLGDMVGYKTQAAKLLEPAEKLQDRYWLAPAYSTAAMSYYFDGDMESAMKYNNLGLAQMPMDPRVLLHRLFIEAVSGNQE
jgi:tetratricopeptide (TPR) repeat protein